jgi:hypothetical protein
LQQSRLGGRSLCSSDRPLHLSLGRMPGATESFLVSARGVGSRGFRRLPQGPGKEFSSGNPHMGCNIALEMPGPTMTVGLLSRLPLVRAATLTRLPTRRRAKDKLLMQRTSTHSLPGFCISLSAKIGGSRCGCERKTWKASASSAWHRCQHTLALIRPVSLFFGAGT